MAKFLGKAEDHLPKSILLEEVGSPKIIQLAIIFSILIMVGFVTWAYETKLNEVAVAQGEIVTQGQIQKIQHVTGGVVTKILISDGDIVEVGQKLIEIFAPVSRGQSDYYEKMMITSPIKGIVHGLKAHSVGEIIQQAATILEIIPIEEKYFAKIRIQPKDIGFVLVGQDVNLKFDTYEFSRFGGLKGTIMKLSATTFFEKQGAPYYRAVIDLESNYLVVGDKQLPILPGMTLTADIKTGQKTVLEYLLKPIFSSATQAMRER